MKPLFSWGGKDDAAPVPGVDEHAQAMGDVPNGPAPNSGTVASHQVEASAAAARAAADVSPRKRGRPRADGGVSGGDSRALQAKIDSAIAAQLDALHDPEAWGALLAMPGDAMVAVTGRELWEISKDEKKTLGITGSAFARTMMITNPRALAGLMLASALFSAYGMRAIKELRQIAEKKKAEKKTETEKQRV